MLQACAANLAGVASYSHEDSVTYLYELHVRERRNRFGTSLIQMVERQSRRAMTCGVMLTVHTNNVDALAFYHAYGFEVSDISPERDDPETSHEYQILQRLHTLDV